MAYLTDSGDPLRQGDGPGTAACKSLMVAVPFDAALPDEYRAVQEAGSAPTSLERLAKVRAEDAAEVPSLDRLRRGGRHEGDVALGSGGVRGDAARRDRRLRRPDLAGPAALPSCMWCSGNHTFDLVVSDAVISRAAWQARRSWLGRVPAAG
ncbi:hypothetical protein [Streptomyces tendae]|uniref:hypothetical protein n=1 Tax=Streptomyces tendae TaxID=1932 RepID=UPI0036C795E2